MAKIYGERWETIKSLGEGGQAHTYVVRDLQGNNAACYVLKRLRDINRIDRFRREIEAIRNLNHENIVRLIDFHIDDPKPYLVTEYCVGGNLAETTPFWSEDPLIAIELFRQICAGVAHAHAQGIIHRDLKPENIFLRQERGPAVVGDFGICYIHSSSDRLTSVGGGGVGPRLFMAPELEDNRDEEVSSRADTYSLGKLLYWLLSGGRVFSREKHRDPQWDLKGANEDSNLGWNNIYMEHVNRLLDVMIVHDKNKRRTVGNIASMLPRVATRIRREFNPVADEIGQPCTYCGYGTYKSRANNLTSVSNFGFVPVGDPTWRIYVCDLCGHVQAFRLDLTERMPWWEEPQTLAE